MMLLRSEKTKRVILTGKKRLSAQISFFKPFARQIETDYKFEDSFDGSGSYKVKEVNGRIIFQYITYLFTNHPDEISSQLDLEKVTEEKIRKHNEDVKDIDTLVELITETILWWSLSPKHFMDGRTTKKRMISLNSPICCMQLTKNNSSLQ
jgi:hypothetical protein